MEWLRTGVWWTVPAGDGGEQVRSVESMLTYPEPTFTLQGTPYLEYLP